MSDFITKSKNCLEMTFLFKITLNVGVLFGFKRF